MIVAILACSPFPASPTPTPTPEPTATPLPPTPTPEPVNTALRLINESAQIVCNVFISLSTNTAWGDDRLGPDETVAPGQSRDFILASGVYDVRAEDCTNTALAEEFQIQVSGPVFTWTLAGGQGGAQAPVRLVNESGRTVCVFNISPTDGPEWGDNLLGESETIPSGQSWDFQVAPGTRSLRAQECDHSLIAEQYGFIITAAGMTWNLPPVPLTLTITNRLSVPVCYVLISPSASRYWGSDWMGGGETLQPGDSRRFAVPPGQAYDMQVLDCDRNSLKEQDGVNITEAGYFWTIFP